MYSLSSLVVKIPYQASSLSMWSRNRAQVDQEVRGWRLHSPLAFFGGNVNDNDNQDRVRTHTRLSSDAVAYTILDIPDGTKNRGASSFQLRHGRDIAFLPASWTDDFYCSSLLVLDSNGGALSITTAITSRSLPEGENERVVESVQTCSLQYEGIIGRRVFALLNGASGENGSEDGIRPPEILIAGYSTVVQRPCLLLSKHRLERADSGISNQLTLVEDVGLGHRLWMRSAEEILSVIELPSIMEDGARANIAVATQERVMILSMDDDAPLSIIVEADVHLTCVSLSPMGSHCVAFSASPSGGHSRLMYLSCLEGFGSQGVIATLPVSSPCTGSTLLAAIRPDRCVYFSSHSGLRMISEGEEDDDENGFVMPLPRTRPLLLLEPLVANALCLDKFRGKHAGTNDLVQRTLHTIIEKFGRKDTSCPHGDDQGIGTSGAGTTSRVYDMLSQHECHVAASVLMTGNVPSDTLVSQPKMLAPWVPMESKLSAIRGETADLMMQVLSLGDNDLSGFLYSHSSDHNCLSSGVLPGSIDMFSILAEELALDRLQKKGSSSAIDTIKLLDLAGRPSSEGLLNNLALSLGTSPSSNNTLTDAERLLKDIATCGDKIGTSADMVSMYANLCSDVSLRLLHRRDDATVQETKKDNQSITVPLSQLAPSVQSVWDNNRVRNAMISSDAIGLTVASLSSSSSFSNSNADPAWRQWINKSKHVWSEGPSGKKEFLLEMDEFEDWFFRCKPAVLGTEGVAIAADTGERTLADILSAASREEEEEDDGTSKTGSEGNTNINDMKNWIEGVGEARDDDDNLSLYLRFSEGDDEDGNWKADGFADLTKNEHSARLYGSELATLEATQSSVDEGEEGKVKLLYDLVYHEGAPRDQPTGLVIEAPRGGTLDVGMLHDSRHSSRQRCTIELWYHLPQAHKVTDEIILVRRSLFYEENGDASKLCMPDEKHNTLWELAVLPTGLLELRTGAGSVVTSAMFIEDTGDEDDVEGVVMWEREGGGGGWNHVCLIFSSHSCSSSTSCLASIAMNGTMVVPSAKISVNPFGSETDQDLNQEDIEEAMEKTVLIFGIGPSAGFRMTDLRVWAIQRSMEDVRMFMHESLRDAEMKKKFKVNIRKTGGKKSSSGGLLQPPIRLPQPESKKGFALAPPPRPSPGNRSLPTSPAADATDEIDSGFMASFADFEEASTTNQVVGMEETELPDGFDSVQMTPDSIQHVANESETLNEPGGTENISSQHSLTQSGASHFANFEKNGAASEPLVSSDATETKVDGDAEVAVAPLATSHEEPQEWATQSSSGNQEGHMEDMEHVIEDEDVMPVKSSFDVTFTDLLSKKVRKSAAAAIIRGPPAARHFGGNRGGLASKHMHFGSKCDGVGPIAICGADKSVVWYSDRDPPGRTYPIGASGAVLSDMDESQSEYMCCFLAKEKRMVVFELSRKTVVVELQMKTKLNFWRYLPREAHGGDLAFMLITPIGGFHWKPLDESPRPCQVWKRGPELESKKILAYEEGGCNGQTGEGAKSTVALVIASSATPRSTAVEAYCIAMNNGSSVMRVSNVILGAALYCPVTATTPPCYFLPFVITISKDVTSQFVLDIEDLREESGTLVRGNIIASAALDMTSANLDDSYEPPSMSMGPSPEALCCCHDGFIVAVIRKKGLVVVYDFSGGQLALVGQSLLGQYVVDAAIRPTIKEGEAELVLLLCESDNPKDGRIANVNISRADGVSSEYLSAI